MDEKREIELRNKENSEEIGEKKLADDSVNCFFSVPILIFTPLITRFNNENTIQMK